MTVSNNNTTHKVSEVLISPFDSDAFAVIGELQCRPVLNLSHHNHLNNRSFPGNKPVYWHVFYYPGTGAPASKTDLLKHPPLQWIWQSSLQLGKSYCVLQVQVNNRQMADGFPDSSRLSSPVKRLSATILFSFPPGVQYR